MSAPKPLTDWQRANLPESLSMRIRRTIAEGERDCWIWMGRKDPKGYGLVSRGSRVLRVHRMAYEDRNGPIPAGMTVDHLCFNPSCLNPEHLRLLGHSENSANQRQALSARCSRGHLFDEANTYDRTRENGQHRRGRRACRACGAENKRRQRAVRRAAA